MYFERRVRLSLFINCSSWADLTHSWALVAGSAFPAGLAGSLANSGLRAWQQKHRRLAAPGEDELVNAVKLGFWSLAGSRKWVTGGDWVCSPYCCSPSVSRKMFLVRQREATYSERSFIFPFSHKIANLWYLPWQQLAGGLGIAESVAESTATTASAVFLLWQRARDCLGRNRCALAWSSSQMSVFTVQKYI